MIKSCLVLTLYQDQDLGNLGRLKKEAAKLGIKQSDIFVYDGRGDNRGYAYGINQGIKKALSQGYNTLVIANTDISIKEITPAAISNGLKHFDILGFAMEQEGKQFYGGQIEPNRLSGGLIAQKPQAKYQQVDFVSGSLMIAKAQVFKQIGLLNENYFMYYEDVEFCWRAKEQGFKVGIDSQTSYQHFHQSQTSTAKNRWLFVNRWKFFWQHSNRLQKMRELIRLPLTMVEHLPLFWQMARKSPFLVNFFSYNFSSVLAKIAHFLIFITLVNYLTPAQYGIYTIVWAFVNVFTPFLDFGTTTYGLVYGETKSKNSSLYSLRTYLAAVVYLAVFITSWVVFTDMPNRIFVWLTATTIFSSSLSGTYLIHNSIRQKVTVSSYLNLGFNLIFSVLVIAAVVFGQNISYLFLAYAACYIGYSLLNTAFLGNNLQLQINWGKWLAIGKQSLVFVAIAFLAGLYFKMDLFMLKKFYNNEALGLYSAGLKFLDALLIFPGSYNIVAIPAMRVIANNRQLLLRKVVKDTLFLISLGVIICVGFYLVAPILLPIVLGQKFGVSLEIARVIAFAIIPLLITSVFYNALYSLKKVTYVLGVQMALTIFSLFAYWLTVPVYGYWGATYAKVIVEIFNSTLAALALLFALRQHEH